MLAGATVRAQTPAPRPQPRQPPPSVDTLCAYAGTWSNTEAGKTTWFRVVNVWSSPTTIDYRQEYSTDQVHWTKSASGHEVKTGPN
jgi:hypothetical protein